MSTLEADEKLTNIFLIAMFALCALLFTAVGTKMAEHKASHPDFVPGAWVSDPATTMRTMEELATIMGLSTIALLILMTLVDYFLEKRRKASNKTDEPT